MKIVAIFKWALFLLLLGGIALGVGGLWFWNHRDQMLQQRIVAAFEVAVPDLQLDVSGVSLVSASCVRLSGVEIRTRPTRQLVMRAEEILATIDETELLERRRVLLKSVRVRRMDSVSTRSADGRWSWQSIRLIADPDNAIVLPDVVIEDARTQIVLEHGHGLPPANLLLFSKHLEAIPASARSYDFAGDIDLPGTGTLNLTGDGNLDSKTWQLGGRLRGVQASPKLVALALTANPAIADHLRQLDSTLAKVLPPSDSVTARGNDLTATADRLESAALQIGNSPAAPRILGLLDLDFRVAGIPGQAVPEFLLKVDIREGQLSSAAVPDTLTDVRASFFWDNRNVIVRLDEARDGDAKLSGLFTMTPADPLIPPEAALHVEDFPVNGRLRPLFPLKAQQFFLNFRPEGLVSGDVTLRRSDAGRWIPMGLTATCANGTAVYHRFRYPVSGISGTIRQRPFEGLDFTPENVLLDVHLTGMAGQRPATATGVIRNPGPETELSFELSGDNFPLDSRFRDALDDAGRAVIDALNIKGTATARAQCYRPPGLDQPTEIQISGVVRDATMKFRGFPYEITQLGGQVTFDSRNKQWTFQNLQGRHNDSTLLAHGVFRGKPLPGVLELEISAQNAALDADLYNALGDSQRNLWSLLNPRGRVNLTTTIDWTVLSGQKAVVRLPSVEIYDAEIMPVSFPYRMKIASLKASFDPNDPKYAGLQHCEIHSLKADHRGALISASGWAELSPDQLWQLHLNDVTAADLEPDDELRAALPDSWRSTLQRLGYKGRVSVESSQLDFRGGTNGRTATTAAWDMNLRLRDCSVSAGLDLDHVTGLVIARGQWDGVHLKNVGEIRLDGVEVLGMPLAGIVGPYAMDESELVLGSRAVFTEPEPAKVAPAAQLQAQGYGGSLLLDGLIDLQGGTGFRMFATVNNALLESYAARHIPDQPNLRGVVNAWLYLRGEGQDASDVSGRGQMQISPAQLYELPVMVQMFGALAQLNFSVPDRTAFNHALLTFDVRNQAFWFDPIDLVGDSLSLRGRGSVGFGGDVVLHFYSRPAQSRRPSIPLVKALVTGATQWVNVEVSGTTERPQTRVRSMPQLDESMKQFLSPFQPNPGGPLPGLKIPNMFGMPVNPQAIRGSGHSTPRTR